MSKICQIPFQETEQQAKKLAEVIAKHKKVPGAVMPVLQQAQDIYGYLPYEVMQRIAEGLDTSMEEIYGVATFYAQFSLYPKGQYNVSVCLGTRACSASRKAKSLPTADFPFRLPAASAAAVWLPFSRSTRRFTAK